MSSSFDFGPVCWSSIMYNLPLNVQGLTREIWRCGRELSYFQGWQYAKLASLRSSLPLNPFPPTFRGTYRGCII